MTTGSVPRRRVPVVEGHAALLAWARAHAEDPAAAAALPRSTRATAVRFALEELATRVPGNSVEVRVPPFGVAQCLPGPRHTRGTPPNVVETDAATWIALATGTEAWAEAAASGRILASGTRADLATLNSDRLREKADFGFLICTGLPTKPMREEIAAAGKFKNPLLNREDDRLQVVTVAELFAPHNRRLDLPMARTDAVKSAAAKGDADKQERLL